jgi:hypothetical protein
LHEVLYRRCYTRPMPTRHRRHTITETPPVERALRRLRTLTPGHRIDLKELLVIGANAKADELERGDETQQRRKRDIDDFLALRADAGIDAEVALALHDSGWTHRM